MVVVVPPNREVNVDTVDDTLFVTSIVSDTIPVCNFFTVRDSRVDAACNLARVVEESRKLLNDEEGGE